MATVNRFMTNILQNIIFCVQQLKEIYLLFIKFWNNLRVSKFWHNFNFWVNYPFNDTDHVIRARQQALVLPSMAEALSSTRWKIDSVKIKLHTSQEWYSRVSFECTEQRVWQVTP